MRKICLFSCIFFISCNIGLFAQGNEIDAYTFSNAGLGGTARSISMGGAFGSLGGDVSVISNNPAGLGIYRSSDVSGTLDLSLTKASTDWSGMKTGQSKTSFSPSNFGVELYFPKSDGIVKNWNLGLSYNRLKNYNRRYRMESDRQPHSISSYVATRASNAYVDQNGNYSGIPENNLIFEKGSYNPFFDNAYLQGHWLPILGYDAGMFGNMTNISDDVYHSEFGEKAGSNGWNSFSPDRSLLYVAESGHIDEYNIGFGMNISDFLFFGASISITDIDYKYTSGYEELFSTNYDKDDHLYLKNWLNSKGTAFSANLGVIMNLQMLRLGVAYNSPRWYDMTDYFDAHAGTYIGRYTQNPLLESVTPENSYSEYRFNSPGKWIFSGSVIIGQTALVSADYEIMNYKSMKYSMKDNRGRDVYFDTNFDIKDDYTWSHTFKLGTEIKLSPQMAVRAGYMMQTSPMREHLANNDYEVLPSGTIPHFTVTSKPINYFTAGFGYRFTPNLYSDMALVFSYNNSNAYAFSNTYYNEQDYGIQPIPSVPAKLTTKTARLVLTLGYKF